jgi:hypothetical protein
VLPLLLTLNLGLPALRPLAPLSASIPVQPHAVEPLLVEPPTLRELAPSKPSARPYSLAELGASAGGSLLGNLGAVVGTGAVGLVALIPWLISPAPRVCNECSEWVFEPMLMTFLVLEAVLPPVLAVMLPSTLFRSSGVGLEPGSVFMGTLGAVGVHFVGIIAAAALVSSSVSHSTALGLGAFAASELIAVPLAATLGLRLSW